MPGYAKGISGAAEAAPDLPAALVVSSNGVDPVDLAVEFTRVVPVSGNMTVCGQQFWLGPDRAGSSIAFWADPTVVHLLANGVRLKTVPSRLTVAHLQRLLAEGARPAGPPLCPYEDPRTIHNSRRPGPPPLRTKLSNPKNPQNRPTPTKSSNAH